MYVIYEDDYAETAMPNFDSDGRIEVIWDHPDFARAWSARWAPWPYDTPWITHSLFDQKTRYDTWGAYDILLLHFGLSEARHFLSPSAVLTASPEAILKVRVDIAKSAVKAAAGLLRELPSCFISHCTADEAFVRKLLMSLKAAGVRCWYAPDDLRIGDELISALRKAVSSNDRVVLVLSKAAIRSGWVREEVTKALADERKAGKAKLLPVMIDELALTTEVEWVAAIRDSRHIGDFRNWRDEAKFRETIVRLLRDLRGE